MKAGKSGASRQNSKKQLVQMDPGNPAAMMMQMAAMGGAS